MCILVGCTCIDGGVETILKISTFVIPFADCDVVYICSVSHGFQSNFFRLCRNDREDREIWKANWGVYKTFLWTKLKKSRGYLVPFVVTTAQSLSCQRNKHIEVFDELPRPGSASQITIKHGAALCIHEARQSMT